MELFCEVCLAITFFVYLCTRRGRKGEEEETYACERCDSKKGFTVK